MRKTTVATAMLAISLFGAIAVRSGDGGAYKTFQLVYHSDTRGYYRPCG